MLKYVKNILTNLFTNYKNYKFYKDFNTRKKEIEKISKQQTLDFIIPQIVQYILKTDNYLITFKQAQALAKIISHTLNTRTFTSN